MFVHFWGRATALELFESWVSYEAGNYQHTNCQPLHHQYPVAFVAPGFYIQSGFEFLLFSVAAFWRQGRATAEHFALIWSAATLVIIAALGRPSNHYFLPLYAPLVMLLALQDVSWNAARRRWALAVIALAFAGSTVFVLVRDAMTRGALDDAVIYSGEKIRQTYGAGAVAMLPWEAYLTSYAVPPSPFFLERDARFAADRDVWTRMPVVYVDDATEHFNRMAPPAYLHLMCRDARLGSVMIISRDPKNGVPCKNIAETAAQRAVPCAAGAAGRARLGSRERVGRAFRAGTRTSAPRFTDGRPNGRFRTLARLAEQT